MAKAGRPYYQTKTCLTCASIDKAVDEHDGAICICKKTKAPTIGHSGNARGRKQNHSELIHCYGPGCETSRLQPRAAIVPLTQPYQLRQAPTTITSSPGKRVWSRTLDCKATQPFGADPQNRTPKQRRRGHIKGPPVGHFWPVVL